MNERSFLDRFLAAVPVAAVGLGLLALFFWEASTRKTPTIFEAQVAGGSVQNSFDLAGNALVNNTTATTASLFTAFPATAPTVATTAAAFDWTPAATSPAISGGLATFTGLLATATATSGSPTPPSSCRSSDPGRQRPGL